MKENRYKIIGQRIKDIREGAGMSQKDLATALEYESPTAVSLIEQGERKVSVEILEKIAHVLQVNMKDLLGDKEERPDLNFALRASKDLSPEAKTQILNFIEFVKAKDGK